MNFGAMEDKSHGTLQLPQSFPASTISTQRNGRIQRMAGMTCGSATQKLERLTP